MCAHRSTLAVAVGLVFLIARAIVANLLVNARYGQKARNRHPSGRVRIPPENRSPASHRKLAAFRITDQSRTIRIPVHMNESMNKFLQATRELEKELGRVPTNDEIGRRMDIPVEKVQKLKTISRDPVSLETPVGRDGESALGDLIEDRWVGSPVDAVIDSNVRDETANILKTLSPKEEKVIRLRFGIGCEREHTLEEIGQEFDVTRERIRQIEAKALRKLRHPSRSEQLRSFLMDD
jgi:RNA polymerase primary sigma factor